jgi:hypothetical protein
MRDKPRRGYDATMPDPGQGRRGGRWIPLLLGIPVVIAVLIVIILTLLR